MNCLGLRAFLYGVLDLIKKGEHEETNVIVDNIQDGKICNYLNEKYKNFNNRFSKDNEEDINKYYQKTDPTNAYDCEENDGLYLLIKIPLDEFA